MSPRVLKMNTRLTMGIVILFICLYKLVFMSKFPGLPFSTEICPLLRENAIKQCSVFFNLWKVEKVTCRVWASYSQNIHTHSTDQNNNKKSVYFNRSLCLFYPYTVVLWQRTRKSNFAEKQQFVFVNFNWQSWPQVFSMQKN